MTRHDQDECEDAMLAGASIPSRAVQNGLGADLWRTVKWSGTAAFSSAVVMGLEMAAARQLAPFFGASADVWGILICLVMLALALGSVVGGWIADLATDDRWLYGAILSAGLCQGVSLWVASPALDHFSTFGLRSGTMLSVALLFLPSMALLAVTPPYLTRLFARETAVGRSAGWVYFSGTLGGIVGIAAVSFWAIPAWGCQTTLQALAIASVVVGCVGSLHRNTVVAGVVGLVLIVTSRSVESATHDAALLFVGQSVYNEVTVQERDGRRALALNRRDGVQGSIRPGEDRADTYTDDLALASVLAPGPRGLVLGLGAGASVHTLHALRPDVEVDAVEIDPLVVDVAARFFGVKPGPRLRIHEADARRWVRQEVPRGPSYGFVQIDLYHGGPYVPFYLSTVEFYEELQDLLIPNGWVIMNVFDASGEKVLLGSTVATLSQVFDQVRVLRRGLNTIVLASTNLSRARRSDYLQKHPDVWRWWGRFASFAAPADAPIWTDDHSNLERMTAKMIDECNARVRDRCR